MKPGLLKQFLPRSLYARAALILIVPIVTIQLVVSITFIQRHFEQVTRQMTGNVLIEIAYLRDQAEAAPDLAAAQDAAGKLGAALALQVTLPVAPDNGDRRQFFDLSGRQMIATLRAGLDGVMGVDLVSDSGAVSLDLATRFGPMRVEFERRRVSASNPHQLLVLMIVTSILMTLIAYAFLRNQLRPITRLALAAEEFGKGRSVAYRPRGANEVRAAGLAFLDMRSRIERQIEQRTLMLSGVSHDLRTPLTRLKLGLAMLPEDAETDALRADVEEMQHLLDGFLSFARGDATEETVEVDIADLVQGVVENAGRAGQAVTLVPPDPGAGRARVRPQAVRRAIENLIGNAVRYGNRAEVSVSGSDRTVKITVEDDGPGIPPDRREEALRPFTRLDAARNQNRGGGVGLGLSITADIARSHGGSLRLLDAEVLDGLRAELVLAR